ncbi:hypothetical protein [Streptococcus suis]|uniref:hypothetical protein n=1 Tax=Streptococcus suis TaxID=1307 RepID=UPI003AF8EFFD
MFHGEAFFDTQKRVQGRVDSPLSEKRTEQAYVYKLRQEPHSFVIKQLSLQTELMWNNV